MKTPGNLVNMPPSLRLANNLDGYAKTVHNVYVPHKGRTSELDVLMVHEKGIFVFESKNYSGWIFGAADQQKWTQCLPNGEKKSFL